MPASGTTTDSKAEKLTQAVVRELLDYNLETRHFT